MVRDLYILQTTLIILDTLPIHIKIQKFYVDVTDVYCASVEDFGGKQVVLLRHSQKENKYPVLTYLLSKGRY